MSHMNNSSLFPSYQPSFPNYLWFDCKASSIIPSDAELKKEEDEYNLMMKKEVNTKIVAIGQTDTVEQNGIEDEELDEDEESNDEVDEDTDEFDTASPELDSMEDDNDMMNDTSGMNESSNVW